VSKKQREKYFCIKILIKEKQEFYNFGRRLVGHKKIIFYKDFKN